MITHCYIQLFAFGHVLHNQTCPNTGGDKYPWQSDILRYIHGQLNTLPWDLDLEAKLKHIWVPVRLFSPGMIIIFNQPKLRSVPVCLPACLQKRLNVDAIPSINIGCQVIIAITCTPYNAVNDGPSVACHASRLAGDATASSRLNHSCYL